MPIHQGETTQLNVGGWAGLAFINIDGDHKLVDSSSRINLQFKRQMTPDWQAEAKLEWGYNLVDGGDNFTLNGDSLQGQRESEFLFSRLGYIALEHQQYGRFSAGKQWSIYYDVAQHTDNFILTGGMALGVYNFNTDGGVSGTGRADTALQYRNNWGNWYLGLQYQARTEDEVGFETPDECNLDNPPPQCDNFIDYDDIEIEYDDSWGAKLAYDDGRWFVGAAINSGNIDDSRDNDVDKDSVYVATIKYGQLYQPGLFAAVSSAIGDHHELDNNNRLFDSSGAELMLAWTTDQNLTYVVGLNSLRSDDADYEQNYGDFKREFYVAGVHYQWEDGALVFIEGQLDSSEFGFSKEDDDNFIGIGVRFFF
ncbi:porin [Ferrimonas lipolytica]|uniref:Porin n=1 Tax=Ferrimonas lipolytica TaxID=2724191 RepID=A0A6H1UDN7_9GAMM|nr:porin [Ferrimonas lipolytica]QIZ77195.1 porin [Ferrimonas lipolytica]